MNLSLFFGVVATVFHLERIFAGGVNFVIEESFY